VSSLRHGVSRRICDETLIGECHGVLVQALDELGCKVHNWATISAIDRFPIGYMFLRHFAIGCTFLRRFSIEYTLRSWLFTLPLSTRLDALLHHYRRVPAPLCNRVYASVTTLHFVIIDTFLRRFTMEYTSPSRRFALSLSTRSCAALQ